MSKAIDIKDLDKFMVKLEKAFDDNINKAIFDPVALKYPKMIRKELMSSDISVTGKTVRSFRAIKNPNTGNYSSVIIAGSKNPAMIFLQPTLKHPLSSLKSKFGIPEKGKFYYINKDLIKSKKTLRNNYSPFIAKWAEQKGLGDRRGVNIGGDNTRWGTSKNLWFDNANYELKQQMYPYLRRSIFKMLQDIKNNNKTI